MQKLLKPDRNRRIEASRIEKLKSIFPEVFSEDKIDFDKLRIILGENICTEEERYDFTWKGKTNALKLSQTPTDAVLIPCKDDSVNWEDTENIYIEGDNIDALKLLLNSYGNKIKMIYIDPPYNTGNDFVYKDDFKESFENYKKLNNNDIYSEGRLHTNWLNIMYPRLRLARELLRDDGVIFISIDDNELDNLKKICDEIFGSENFINCIAVKMSEATGVKMSHQYKRFPKLKEYILFYKKNSFNHFVCIDKYKQEVWDNENNIFLENMTQKMREELIACTEKENISQEELNKINNLLKKVKKVSLAEKIKELKIPENKIDAWKFNNAYRIIKTVGSTSLTNVVKNLPKLPNQEIASSLSKDNVLFFYITDFNKTAREPRLRVIFADENIYKNPCDFWQDIKTSGAIAKEGGIKYKNGKKPLKLLNRMLKMTTKDDDIVLDFFAGSGTTGHAVMELNRTDGGNRHFILVQLPENLDLSYKNTKGETKKDIKDAISLLDELNKPHLLTELSKERLRRSGEIIREQNPSVDTGFRVYKICNP